MKSDGVGVVTDVDGEPEDRERDGRFETCMDSFHA